MTNEEAYNSLVELLWEKEENINEMAILLALDALEKQVPKKLGKADFGNHKNFFDKCPNCGYESAGSHFKYCHECGQCIDWG